MYSFNSLAGVIPKNTDFGKMLFVLIAVILHTAIARSESFDYTVNFDCSELRESIECAPNGKNYYSFEWEGMMHSVEVGSPDLPVKYINFLIPTYCNNLSVKLGLVSKEDSRNLEYPVIPVQEAVSTNQLNEYSFTNPAPESYENSNQNPMVFVEKEYFLGGSNHIVTIGVHPCSYIGKDQILEVYDQISFTVEFDDCSEDDMNFRPLFSANQNGSSELDDLIIDVMGILDKGISKAASASISTAKRYYIITPKSLKDAVNDLAVWKTQKGYIVVVKTIEEILSDPTYAVNASKTIGINTLVDEAASLRAYLTDEYTINGVDYCLLMGNSSTSMPIRRVYISDYESTNNSYINGDNYIPTDNYFSDLTSKWTLSLKNGIYSTKYNAVDYSATIPIGRLLCNTAEEVNNYISKLILYESNPGYGNNAYLSKTFFFEQDCTNRISLKNESEKFMPYLEKIFSTIDFVSDDHNCTPASIGSTGSNIISRMANYGFNSWYGHGNPGSVGTSSKWHGISALDYYIKADIGINDEEGNGLDVLGNNDYPGIVYSIACDVTPFDQLKEYENLKFNMGSSFTVSGSYGGPALLGNTRSGYVSNSTYLENYFLDQLVFNPKIGLAEMKSKLFMSTSIYDRYVVATHSLIGEPEFEIWLGKPKSMNINLEVSSILPSDSKMVCYDGLGNIATLTNSLTATPNFPTNFDKNDYMISVWKTGYLPYISYFGQNHTLKNRAKTFIVREAKLGSSVTTTKLAGPYTVGSGGKLTVKAIDSLTTTTGFIIEAGGEVELECNRTIYLNGGEIKAGGKLNTCSKELVMGSGFILNPGATITMSTPK